MTQERMKFLEFIQNVITRMNTNSSQMKTICITIISALFAVYAANQNKGEQNIKNWIDKQMKDCDCVIVLIGEKTHTRKWVRYEAKRAKELGIPIFGIFIHNLKDNEGKTTKKGQNVFNIQCYEPNPKDAYQDIRNNLESWINRNTFSLSKIFGGFGILIIASFFLLYYKKITSVLANA